MGKRIEIFWSTYLDTSVGLQPSGRWWLAASLSEKTDSNSIWRGQHQEGPIDDEWASLRLNSDEGTWQSENR